MHASGPSARRGSSRVVAVRRTRSRPSRSSRKRGIMQAMNEDVELHELLKAHQAELKTIAEAAGSGNRDKVIDAVSSLAISLATGNPALGALAPLARKGIAHAFGNTVNAALT